MESLNDKLTAALADLEAARAFYKTAALAEENGEPGTDDAARGLETALDRVARLRAAIEAADDQERQRQAAEQSNAEEEHAEAIRSAVEELQRSGAKFDEVLDILQQAGDELNVAAEKVCAAVPAANVQMQTVRGIVLSVVEQRLRSLVGLHNIKMFPLARLNAAADWTMNISPHLPAQPAKLDI